MDQGFASNNEVDRRRFVDARWIIRNRPIGFDCHNRSLRDVRVVSQEERARSMVLPTDFDLIGDDDVLCQSLPTNEKGHCTDDGTYSENPGLFHD